MMSQWDVRIIFILFGIIIFYGLISVFLNLLTIRCLMTFLIKKGWFESIKESFMAKRPCIIMAMTVVTFAAILGIIRMITKQNFIIMASDLLVEFSWLVGVILISLLLRVGNDPDQECFPHLFSIDADRLLRHYVPYYPDSKRFGQLHISTYSVALHFMAVECHPKTQQESTTSGHDLHMDITGSIHRQYILFVDWFYPACRTDHHRWMMQLTCILSITCIKDWLEVYAERKNLKHKPITNKWFFRFINKVALPVAGVFSFIIAIYWAAAVFNMSDTTWMIFNKHYIDSENFSASLYSLSLVACLYFLFNYLNITTTDIMRHHFEKSDPTSAASKIMMFKNVLQVVVWGIRLMIALTIFHVGKSLVIGHLRRFINGSGFCIERHLGEHLLWRFPHDGSRESWRLHHL